MRASTAVVLLSFALGVCAPAAAQDDESAADADSAASTEGADQNAETAEASDGEPAGAAAVAAAPGSHAWSFGPYVRYSIVPAFMLNLFVDLAPTIGNPGFGATATYRGSDDGPSFDMGLGYQSFAFSGPFRAKGGDPNDTEWIESSLGMVHLTGSILWEAKFAEKFAFQYGVGLDVGIVTGELKRTEATQNLNGSWSKCPGIGLGIYCGAPLTGAIGSDPYDKKGEQYNQVQGNVPPIFALPMLPHLALRYTPIPELWVRLEAAYNIASFWFGLSAAYSPEL